MEGTALSAAGKPDPRLMVPIREAALLLGASVATLKRAGETGEVPVLRIRTLYLIPRAWLAEVTAWPKQEAS